MGGSGDSPIPALAAPAPGAAPDVTRPVRLEFRLEGTQLDPAWQLRWSAGRLEFQAAVPGGEGGDDEHTVALFEPSREQWEEFWRVVDELDVWTWSSEYAAPAQVPAWSLELARPDRRVRSAGHGAFPRTGAPTPSGEFRVLLEALRGLVDGRRIG